MNFFQLEQIIVLWQYNPFSIAFVIPFAKWLEKGIDELTAISVKKEKLFF